MTDDHYPFVCEDCGERPRLVRLGERERTEHASFGVECGCEQPDGETPVGSYVDVVNVPDAWDAVDD